jgi:hypothetical protein
MCTFGQALDILCTYTVIRAEVTIGNRLTRTQRGRRPGFRPTIAASGATIRLSEAKINLPAWCGTAGGPSTGSPASKGTLEHTHPFAGRADPVP